VDIYGRKVSSTAAGIQSCSKDTSGCPLLAQKAAIAANGLRFKDEQKNHWKEKHHRMYYFGKMRGNITGKLMTKL
jgi:hypothetical protein